MYLQCDSAYADSILVKGWTHCTADNAQNSDGIELRLCAPEEGISIPFSGFLRFEIPEEGQLEENAGLCIEINAPACTITHILLNNVYNKPVILSMEPLRFGSYAEYIQKPVLLFPIIAPSVVRPTASDEGSLQFDFLDLKENEYFLFYRKMGETDKYREEFCEIFLPKQNYLPNETITVSYRNVNDFEYRDGNATNIMFYMDGDIPGKTPSQEYVILKLSSYSRSPSGCVVIPRDGVRFNTEDASGLCACGHYYVRLLQKYQPLCPEQEITISTDNTVSYMNAPPPAGLFYIRASNLSKHIVFSGVLPEQLICIRFACHSPIMDVFEQHLQYMPFLQKYSANLNRETTGDLALLPFLNFVFYGMYQDNIGGMHAKIAKNHAGLICHKIINFIEENICGDTSMQKLCEKFYCSESYLSHIFKKYMRISISSYIYRSKVAKAKQLLCSSNMTISEIATLLQYSDVHSFSRSFKKMTGISPVQYRRKHT